MVAKIYWRSHPLCGGKSEQQRRYDITLARFYQEHGRFHSFSDRADFFAYGPKVRRACPRLQVSLFDRHGGEPMAGVSEGACICKVKMLFRRFGLMGGLRK